jgi:integrase
VNLAEVLDQVERELLAVRPRGAEGLHRRLGALREVLGGRAVADLWPGDLEAYRAARRAAGAPPRAIREELAVLRRAIAGARAAGIPVDPGLLRCPRRPVAPSPVPAPEAPRGADLDTLRAIARPGLRFGEPVRRTVRGKVGKNFSVQVYDPATRKRSWKTTGTPDPDAAAAWLKAARIRAALSDLAPRVEAEVLTVADALDRWLRAERSRLRPRTHEDLRSHGRAWRRALGARRLRDVTPEDLEGLLDRPGRGGPRAASTRAHEIQLLRWLFAWARKRGLVQKDPTAALSRPRVPRRAVRVLTEEEEARLLAAAAPVLRPLLVLAIETGLRRRALLGLTWAHIDFGGGWLRLPGSLLKSGNDFQVPLSPRALELLADLHRARRTVSPRARVFALERSQVNRLFRMATHAAGIEGLKLHDLRRTFCTRALRRGVPLEVVARLSDHRDLKVLLAIYREVAEEELLRAVGRGGREKEAGA